MTFQELFQQVKSRFLGADVSQVSDPTRIQINLTGQAAGTFYVEMKGGHLAIEPYEYHDRDVEITISDENFQKLIDGKLDPVAASGPCGKESHHRHERRGGFQRGGPSLPAAGLRLRGRHLGLDRQQR